MNYPILNNTNISSSLQQPRIHRPSRTIILTVPSRDESNIRSIFQLEPRYIARALTAAQAFQGAIGSDLNFNYDKAIQIANTIPYRDHSNISWHMNRTVIQETLQVSPMISKIKDILGDFLYFINISNAGFWNEVEAAIINTFTNLYTQTNSAWIFWSSSTSTSTSYYYNILFAIPSTSKSMVVIPIAFDITVRLEKQKVLFITIKDRAEFRVTIKAIYVHVLLHSLSNQSIVDVFNPKN
ncbi:TPA: hypothetical protein QCX85_005221 [Bacillus toyonensis]|uniref:hypothetical protein n=1 Tax=Bacillus toyonensis TaxID=155322 RepID=UPI000D030435|nr:hypothetical protein [Bacillus toyonensis]PRT14216.1 hypothetical protein C6353_25780 [Bacillus toyonensis]HDR7689672.1 hypothetical protein [Bacillus toyonensis]